MKSKLAAATKKCPHDTNTVIPIGDPRPTFPVQVRWCHDCGSLKLPWMKHWKSPRAARRTK